VVNGLPRGMDMITPEEVIRRVELYFKGGTLKYLTARQRRAAERGVVATAKNAYDQQPLTIHNARMACERFIKTTPKYPGRYQGRGIVICGGGAEYFNCALVVVYMPMLLGCRLSVVFRLWGEG